MASVKVSCMVVVMCMVLVGGHVAEAAITCGQVTGKIAPCITYLRGTVGAPPPTCCSGVKQLNSAARTTPDRQTACSCLKSASSSIGGLIPARAEGLPGKCGVSIPYKISTSTNCKAIK